MGKTPNPGGANSGMAEPGAAPFEGQRVDEPIFLEVLDAAIDALEAPRSRPPVAVRDHRRAPRLGRQAGRAGSVRDGRGPRETGMTPEGAGAEAPHYVVERVRDAIARAPDVNELDIRVTVVGGKVFIAGTVATPERREAITDIMGGLLPGYDVQNETDVLTLGDAQDI